MTSFSQINHRVWTKLSIYFQRMMLSSRLAVLLFGVCCVEADLFFPSSLQIRRGGSVGYQDLDALETNEQTGSEDNWPSYLELSKRFKGDFTVQVADGNWGSLTVHLNFKGNVVSVQRWKFYVKNVATNSWKYIGDNTGSSGWVWYNVAFPVAWNDWLSADNTILLRVVTNSHFDDVLNLDYLAVDVVPVAAPPPVYHPHTVALSAGGFTGSQAISVLTTHEQSGTQDIWDSYMELTEDFVGDFIVTVPVASNAALTVVVNMRGEAHQYQIWEFSVWDIVQNAYVVVGDNSASGNWVWSSVEFTLGAGDWLDAAAQMRVRVVAVESGDILNIDYLGVQAVVGVAPPTPPTTTSPPPPTTTPPPSTTSPPPPPTTPKPTPTSPPSFVNRALSSSITQVQPMTGIVLWASSHVGAAVKEDAGNIQLEYAYQRIDDVVTAAGTYSWTGVDDLLDEVQTRGHQTVLRFYYVYPGAETTVPAYIKALSDYHETIGTTEGKQTHFPDWSHAELQSATLDFYSALVSRYNSDPRLAFLQVGFGLWGEYHIYQPGVVLGDNFPTKAFQEEVLRQLDEDCTELRWSISIDAGSSSVAPLAGDSDLRALDFGLFDDSFMHAGHADYNRDMFLALDHTTRYPTAPIGGELGYYTAFDQQNALNVGGMHGRTYEELSTEYHVSYMLGNDQPRYQTVARIREAGMANGYSFKVTELASTNTQTRITVQNTGMAPIYYNAYVAINGVQSDATLKGLLPGASLTTLINSGGTTPTVTIESARLVPGQQIEFEADLQA